MSQAIKCLYFHASSRIKNLWKRLDESVKGIIGLVFDNHEFLCGDERSLQDAEREEGDFLEILNRRRVITRTK